MASHMKSMILMPAYPKSLFFKQSFIWFIFAWENYLIADDITVYDYAYKNKDDHALVTDLSSQRCFTAEWEKPAT